MALRQVVRGGSGGLPNTSLVYHFGRWFDLRCAWHLARRLTHGTSVDGSILDGPGIWPDGSLAVLWPIVYRFGD